MRFSRIRILTVLAIDGRDYSTFLLDPAMCQNTGVACVENTVYVLLIFVSEVREQESVVMFRLPESLFLCPELFRLVLGALRPL